MHRMLSIIRNGVASGLNMARSIKSAPNRLKISDFQTSFPCKERRRKKKMNALSGHVSGRNRILSSNQPNVRNTETPSPIKPPMAPMQLNKSPNNSVTSLSSFIRSDFITEF